MGENLGMHYIVDSFGNYYRVNGNDQLVAARCRDEASVFTIVEANKRIGVGKKARFYQTIPVDVGSEENNVDEPENKPGMESENEIVIEPVKEQVKEEHINEVTQLHTVTGKEAGKSRDFFAVKKNQMPVNLEYNIAGMDWLDYMNLFCYLTDSSRNYHDEMTDMHSSVEKEICDLLHYIELYDLTDEEAAHAVDLLKDARQRRRDIKDEVARVELFQHSIGTSSNAAKVKGCIRELNKMESRIYRPRELPELFVGMEERETDKEVYREQHGIYMKRSGAVQDNTDIEENTGEESQRMEYKRQDTVYDGKNNDWLTLAKEQLDFFADSRQYMINLEIDLEETDRRIEDILTEIEDANYNVTQGYKAFRELKELRNSRKRKIAELNQLQVITECFDCEAMEDAYQYVVEQIERMMAEQKVMKEESDDTQSYDETDDVDTCVEDTDVEEDEQDTGNEDMIIEENEEQYISCIRAI